MSEQEVVIDADSKKKLAMLTIQSLLMKVSMHLIDSGVLWVVWKTVAVSAFKAPELSIIECIFALVGVNLILSRRKL